MGLGPEAPQREGAEMREDVGNVVHKTLLAGVELKERLARGESPDFEKEQAKLKGLLGDADARRYPEFIGDVVPDHTLLGGRSGAQSGGKTASDYFLGIRYALVCWLDEIFILDSPWSSQWNEDSLEVALYGMRDRAHNFWSQARRAETRPGDALEAFYLCVMLGFRGEFVDQAERLQNWVQSTHALIAKSQGGEWPMPQEIDPPTFVPPLRGRDMLQRMVMVGGGVMLLLILIGSLYLVFKAGS
jgi:type VI secretion system protein ImpK